MTVREVTSVLRYAKTISLVWDDFQHQYNPLDNVMVNAFGDYKVSFINAYCPNPDTGTCEDYEIGIAVRPIKEGYTC